MSVAFAFAKLSFPFGLSFSMGLSVTILDFSLVMSAVLAAFSMGAGATGFKELFVGLRLDGPAVGCADALTVFVGLSYREC